MSIADNVFYDCSGLISEPIGESVRKIGAQAFKNCPEPDNVTVNAGNPPAAKEDSVDESTYTDATLVFASEFTTISQTNRAISDHQRRLDKQNNLILAKHWSNKLATEKFI